MKYRTIVSMDFFLFGKVFFIASVDALISLSARLDGAENPPGGTVVFYKRGPSCTVIVYRLLGMHVGVVV